MALHFEIKVNRERIGQVVIQRHRGGLANQPCRYSVSVEYPIGRHVDTEVDHLYTDGAVALIVKALGAILEENRGV